MWSKLDGQVRDLFGVEADEYVPYLGTMLGLDVPPEHVERVQFLDGEAMRRQVFLSVRRLVERLAGTQPLVLVFEDLHWMDETSSELLQHLLPLVESAPSWSSPSADWMPARRLSPCARCSRANTEIDISRSS